MGGVRRSRAVSAFSFLAVAAIGITLFVTRRNGPPRPSGERSADLARADAGAQMTVAASARRADSGVDGVRPPAPPPDPTAADGEICSRDGWCWQWPRPQGAKLTALWGAGDDLWAGGEGDVVIRRHGGAWRYAGGDGLGRVVAVAGRNASDVWALGAKGELGHWVNGAWKENVFEIRDQAKDAGGTADGEIEFAAIWASPSGQVWAVGGIRDDVPRGKEDDSGDRSTVAFAAHFDGQRWELHEDDDAYPLNCVWGTSDRDVWACVSGSGCLHWNGRKLSKSRKDAPEAVCTARHGDAAEAARWYRNEGRLLSHSGAAALATPFGISDFFARGKDDVWVVGDAGVISRWNGSAWSPPRVDLDGGAIELHDVWADARGRDAWAVGSTMSYGVGTILRGIDSQWSLFETEKLPGLFRIAGAAPAKVWMLGDKRTVLRWDGRAFGAASLPASAKKGLGDAVVAADGELWLPAGPQIVHGRPGRWQTIEMPERQSALKLAVASPNDVWAYARTEAANQPPSVLLHWDGTSWRAPFTAADEQEALGPWREIHAMRLSPGGTLWLTDRYQVARVTPEGRLEKMAEVPPSNRYDHWYLGLAVPADDEVWVSGSGGIFSWNGRDWHREETPGLTRLEAMHATATGLWAVGPNAILSKRRAPSPSPSPSPPEDRD
jgi:hypothetical protein